MRGRFTGAMDKGGENRRGYTPKKMVIVHTDETGRGDVYRRKTTIGIARRKSRY